MPAKKYRVAVVGGAGTWGRHYLRAYAQHPNCQVIALVDRARDRRREFAELYGIDAVYDTLGELLAREIPDIVSAVIPVAHNCEVVTACAEAGVRVVSCEKPIAAELSQADAMVRICREHGTVFSCGSVYSGVPYLQETIEWVRSGHLGPLQSAVIPGGLPREVSGGCCVQLTLLRLLSGLEVEWAEGWALPPDKGWMPPSDAPDTETDSTAYGRLGLTGGIICQIPAPGSGEKAPGTVGVTGTQGQVWFSSPRPTFIQDQREGSTQVVPAFLETPPPDDFFTLRIERLMRAVDSGRDELDSGRGYHQALEIAIALKQSAQRDHQRISLPLENRSLRLFPHPYRLQGGDVAGWESIGSKGPPQVE